MHASRGGEKKEEGSLTVRKERCQQKVGKHNALSGKGGGEDCCRHCDTDGHDTSVDTVT